MHRKSLQQYEKTTTRSSQHERRNRVRFCSRLPDGSDGHSSPEPDSSYAWAPTYSSTSTRTPPISGSTPSTKSQKRAGETTITVIGNLTNDPELRFTPSGSAVANFTIASTPADVRPGLQRVEGRRNTFPPCSVWREAAENVAESLTKGMRVIVTGRLKSRSYETKEGEKRTVIELEVDEIGPSLRYANAKVNRTQRSDNQGGQASGGGGLGGNTTASDSNGWGNGPDNEPAF